jgi:hypothetical protein
VIPHAIAKRGKGKVVRIPTAVRERLEAVKADDNPYVFAGFSDEVERALKSCHAVTERVNDFETPAERI